MSSELCRNRNLRTGWECSLPLGHEGWHQSKENLKTIIWDAKAGVHYKEPVSINFIIPENFRAVPRGH